jgi:peptidoglycan/LPS O-acetylase OafA/YrhL
MNNERLHYMDNLRAFAMLLGVLFHAALAYSTSLHQVWPAADANHSVLVDFFFRLQPPLSYAVIFPGCGFFCLPAI